MGPRSPNRAGCKLQTRVEGAKSRLGVLGVDRGAASYPSDLELARRRADRGTTDLWVAPRTSSRVRGHGSGPSVACRPFSEPASRTCAASELARFNVSQNPLSGQMGPWGAKKEQKDSHNERS